jgi:hypothetical protein
MFQHNTMHFNGLPFGLKKQHEASSTLPGRISMMAEMLIRELSKDILRES